MNFRLQSQGKETNLKVLSSIFIEKKAAQGHIAKEKILSGLEMYYHELKAASKCKKVSRVTRNV